MGQGVGSDAVGPPPHSVPAVATAAEAERGPAPPLPLLLFSHPAAGRAGRETGAPPSPPLFCKGRVPAPLPPDPSPHLASPRGSTRPGEMTGVPVRSVSPVGRGKRCWGTESRPSSRLPLTLPRKECPGQGVRKFEGGPKGGGWEGNGRGKRIK